MGSQGLIIRRKDVANVLAALATRPFLIVSGPSGTGKTQLVRRLAAAVSERGMAWVKDGFHRFVTHGVGGELPGGGHLFSPAGSPEHVTVGDVGTLSAEEQRTLDERRVAFLPVRPDWNDSKKIWGHYSPLSGRFHPTDALAVLLNAYRDYLHNLDQAARHFILLDEMNLARVEYYLSDLLSLMEAGCRVDREDPELVHLGEMARIHPLEACLTSLGFRGVAAAPPPQPQPFTQPTERSSWGSSTFGEPQPERQQQNRVSNARPQSEDQLVPLWELEEDRWLYEPLVKAQRVVRRQPGVGAKATPTREGRPPRRTTLQQLFPIPPRITFPPNLTIVGTVNVDETTFSFAPKVLDRAFVVDLSNVDHAAVFGQDPRFEAIREVVEAIHAILEPWDLQIGYRVISEMMDFIDADQARDRDEVLDDLIRSKILPRVAGSEERVTYPVARLLELCLVGPGRTLGLDHLELLRAATKAQHLAELTTGREPRFPESAKKLLTMARRLMETGFTSYF